MKLSKLSFKMKTLSFALVDMSTAVLLQSTVVYCVWSIATQQLFDTIYMRHFYATDKKKPHDKGSNECKNKMRINDYCGRINHVRIVIRKKCVNELVSGHSMT